jgi:predicted RNA-binding Zn ribbon-like protein
MQATRPPLILVGDSPGIDFLNSTARPVDVPVEWLETGEDLIDWLGETDLVPGTVLGALRRGFLPGELDATAVRARVLREWFRGFVDRHRGRRLKAEDLQELGPLNQLLERDDSYVQIAKAERRDNPKHSPFVQRPTRCWRSPESLLIPIARAMAALVCNEDFVHIKSCEGATCTFLFLDRTHGRARRWCSMAVCGNRAKQAAHRRRGRL